MISMVPFPGISIIKHACATNLAIHREELQYLETCTQHQANPQIPTDLVVSNDARVEDPNRLSWCGNNPITPGFMIGHVFLNITDIQLII